MIRRRMDGRSIALAASGTVVMAGTANAQRHYQRPQYYVPPAQANVTAELQQLTDFYNRGLLAEEEYAAARQKLLAG